MFLPPGHFCMLFFCLDRSNMMCWPLILQSQWAQGVVLSKVSHTQLGLDPHTAPLALFRWWRFTHQKIQTTNRWSFFQSSDTSPLTKQEVAFVKNSRLLRIRHHSWKHRGTTYQTQRIFAAIFSKGRIFRLMVVAPVSWQMWTLMWCQLAFLMFQNGFQSFWWM